MFHYLIHVLPRTLRVKLINIVRSNGCRYDCFFFLERPDGLHLYCWFNIQYYINLQVLNVNNTQVKLVISIDLGRLQTIRRTSSRTPVVYYYNIF